VVADLDYTPTDRADVGKGTPDIFFKLVKSWKETKGTYPPPTLVSHTPMIKPVCKVMLNVIGMQLLLWC